MIAKIAQIIRPAGPLVNVMKTGESAADGGRPTTGLSGQSSRGSFHAGGIRQYRRRYWEPWPQPHGRSVESALASLVIKMGLSSLKKAGRFVAASTEKMASHHWCWP